MVERDLRVMVEDWAYVRRPGPRLITNLRQDASTGIAPEHRARGRNRASILIVHDTQGGAGEV